MNQQTHFDLIVIGGGPAGFFGALSAAEVDPSLRILILEKGSKLLRKVRISGGGRCNLTHACFDPAELVTWYPRGGRELRGPFTRFQPRDTLEWFKSRGVQLKTEPDGRMFPVTDDSASVVDCLLNEANRLGIAIRTQAGVTAISQTGRGYRIDVGEEILNTRNLLIAAGGGNQPAYQMIASLGHTIIPPVPSLFTFEIRDQRIEGLAGITVQDVALTIADPSAQRSAQIHSNGPLLVTHWGLSGPSVLKLSAWGARVLADARYRLPLTINWLPEETGETAFKRLRQNKISTPRQQIGAHPLDDQIPSRLWERLVAAASIPRELPWTQASDRSLQSLATQLTAGEFQIIGKGVFKEEFVTCGGVSLKEIDFRTMESKTSPGLYFAGEILDIDGVTGGFNFQACWTTGWLAGRAIGFAG